MRHPSLLNDTLLVLPHCNIPWSRLSLVHLDYASHAPSNFPFAIDGPAWPGDISMLMAFRAWQSSPGAAKRPPATTQLAGSRAVVSVQDRGKKPIKDSSRQAVSAKFPHHHTLTPSEADNFHGLLYVFQLWAGRPRRKHLAVLSSVFRHWRGLWHRTRDFLRRARSELRMMLRSQDTRDGGEGLRLSGGARVGGRSGLREHDESLAHGGLAGGAEERDGAGNGMLEHTLQDDEVRGLDLVRRGVEEAGEGLPPKPVRGRIGGFGASEVAQGDGGEAGAEAEEALVVLVLGDVVAARGRVPVLAHPAEPLAAGGGLLAAGDAEEEWTAAVEFRPEQVDQRDAVELVVGFAEDDGGQDAERIGRQAVDGAFGDELADHTFGEMVEQKQKDSWALGRCCRVACCGGFLRVIDDVLRDVNLWAGGAGGFCQDGIDLVGLQGC
nr:hypothetical protein CFP56_01030 [Quercus suber]